VVAAVQIALAVAVEADDPPIAGHHDPLLAVRLVPDLDVLATPGQLVDGLLDVVGREVQRGVARDRTFRGVARRYRKITTSV